MPNEKNVEKNRNVTPREMPHSLEAEQALLGCLLIDVRIQVEIAAFLKKEDFYAESHKYIFGAMESIIAENRPVDFVTLTDCLEKNGELERAGGITYITELTNVMPSAANYQRYLDIVKRDSMLRKLIRGAGEIIKESEKSKNSDSTLAYAEKVIYDISNNADTSEVVPISSVLPEVMNKFDELSKNKSSYHGIKTGFKGIDKILNGLHGSDLIILAARPATGKTSFAMNLVEAVALQGYTCAVFSLEMGKEQLGQRLICSVADVSMANALKGQLTRQEWVKIAKAREVLSNSKIYIDDSSMITPEQILSKCRRLKKKVGLDFVMIDYIQLMQPSRRSDSRTQDVGEISRNLKILAKELNVPVLALSQLSRAVESRGGEPQLADLRESGSIEQDADIVMFIHRPDVHATEKEKAEGKYKPNVAKIIIAKHRNGACDNVNLYFQGDRTKFLNINEETGETEWGDKAKTPPTEKGLPPRKTEENKEENTTIDSNEVPSDIQTTNANIDTDDDGEGNPSSGGDSTTKSIDEEIFG